MNILKITILGLFFGTFGTTIGGIIGCFFNKVPDKFLSFILSFASGLMMAVVCFDLIPEAIGMSNIVISIFGILCGIIIMFFCNYFVEKYFKKATKFNNNLIKTGIIVSIGLCIHNFPEGLAIGSSFDVSIKFGISLALAICLHDIPEGMSMAVPMKKGGMKIYKILFLVIFSGITTGIGALAGVLIGDISEKVIASALSFAAGCMLYIVSIELIPESNILYSGRFGNFGNIIGFIIGTVLACT